MKIKNLLIAALLIAGGAPAMAQATLDDAIKAVKSNSTVKEKEVVCKEALKAYKKDAEAISKIGRAYLDIKDTLMTRVYAEKAIKADKKAAAGYLLLGDLGIFCDNPGAAASWYESAKYYAPNTPEAYKKLAFIYRGSDPEQSVEILNQLRSIDPSYPVDAEAGHIYYLTAKAKGGNYMEKALDCYSKVDKTKLEKSYLTEYALVAFASGKFDKARELAEYGLKSDSRNAGYNRLAMYNSVELKDFDSAVKYVDNLFNKSDSVEITANDYKYAGLAYTGAKNFDEAIKCYEKQYEVAEGDSKIAVLKSLSDAYKGKDDYDNAIAKDIEYINAKADPSVNDYVALANLYRGATSVKDQDGQIECIKKAVDTYQTMIQKFPTSADYANFMAARTIQTLDPDQKQGLALPYYEALASSIEAAGVKSDQDKTRIKEAYTYVGIYYFKIKDDSAKAKPYFEKLISVDPDNALAKQVLETY